MEKQSYIKRLYNDLKSIMSISNLLIISIAIDVLLFVLDYNNIPSKIGFEYVISGLLIIFIIGLIKMKEKHFFQLFKVKSINTVDCCLITSLISIVIYIILIFIPSVSIYYAYKVYLLGLFLIINIIMLIYRYTKVTNNTETKNSPKNITLKDVYNDKLADIDFTNEVLISEKSVEYDLLNRDDIVEKLKNSILNNACEEGLVIGLEGEWGSGKSTIINQTIQKIENNNELLIINDFKPWIYGNEDKMLSDMIKSILNKIGIKYLPYELSKNIKQLIQIMSEGNNYPTKYLMPLLDSDSTSNLKNVLARYIKESNKKIVFVIDDLDRLNSEDILLIFKVVNQLFDINNLIFVLAYDKDRVSKIFNDLLQINPKFIEKIVQKEIQVPNISVETKSMIIKTCLNNILKIYDSEYDASIEYSQKYSYIVEYLVNRITNLRELKRYLNSVVFPIFNKKERSILNEYNLIKNKYFAIKTLKYFDNDIYTEISKNKRYLVAYDENNFKDKYKFGEISFSNNKMELLNNIAKNKFTLKFISTIFDIYNIEFILDEWHKNKNYFGYLKSSLVDFEGKTISNNDITHEDSFDIYFIDEINNDIETKVDDFIKKINKADKVDKAKEICKKFVINQIQINEDRYIEILSNKVNNINKNYKVILNSLLDSYQYMDHPRDGKNIRCYQKIYSSLIHNCINDKKEKFVLSDIKNPIKNLYILFETQYKEDDDLDEFYEFIEKNYDFLRKKVNYIIDNIIDIYNEKYYAPANISVIHELKGKEVLYTYLDNVINKNNFCKLLRDWFYYKTFHNEDLRKTNTSLAVNNFSRDIEIYIKGKESLFKECYPKNHKEEMAYKAYRLFQKDDLDKQIN